MLGDTLTLLTGARHTGYALAAAPTADLPACEALIEAAGKRQAPLLLACHLEHLGPLDTAAGQRFVDGLYDRAQAAPGPVALLLDGLSEADQVGLALHGGFSAAILPDYLLPKAESLAGQAGLALIADVTGDDRLTPDSQTLHRAAALRIHTGSPLPAATLETVVQAADLPVILRPTGLLSDAEVQRSAALGLSAIDCEPDLNATVMVALQGLTHADDLLHLRAEALAAALTRFIDLGGSGGQAIPAPIDIPAYAQALFVQGYTCAEAIFLAFSAAEDYPSAVAQRAAASFVGGMANQGLTCGTLIGGLMVIGAREAHTNPQYKLPRRAARALAVELIQWYQSQQGSTNCRDLLLLDLSDPTQASQFSREQHFGGVCMPLMGQTCAWLVARFKATQSNHDQPV